MQITMKERKIIFYCKIIFLLISLNLCYIQTEKEKCYSQLRDRGASRNHFRSNEDCLLIYLLYQSEEKKNYKNAIDNFTYECLQSRKAEYECGKKSEIIPTNNSGSSD